MSEREMAVAWLLRQAANHDRQLDINVTNGDWAHVTREHITADTFRAAAADIARGKHLGGIG